MRALRIGVVGELDRTRPAHVATEDALAHAARAERCALELDWLDTGRLERDGAAGLERFHGFFVAPGSPYRSMAGALAAIRFARERGRPLLGTCGGFQHVVLEFARNVLGVADAGHAEYDPDSPRPVITPLACSLAGQRATVRLEAGSRLAKVYGAREAEEEYRCSFGLDPGYRAALHQAGLSVAAIDAAGDARAVELAGHPFLFGTLYVPQLSSRPGDPHPLLRAFVAAAAAGMIREVRSIRRRGAMAKKIPRNHQRLIPYHHYRDPDAAIDFLTKAFGFALRFAHRDEDGQVQHAQLGLGDSTLMLGPARAMFGSASPSDLHALHSSVWCYVPDVDAHCATARANGATIRREPQDQPYGVREYDALDPEGQEWYFVTPLDDRLISPPAKASRKAKSRAKPRPAKARPKARTSKARTAKPARKKGSAKRPPRRKP